MSTFIETKLSKWDQIFNLDRYFLSPFVFRGQMDSTWMLETSIERAKRDFSKFKMIDGFNTEEKWMLHEFMRKSHLYSDYKLSIEDKFEWLAVMQHHGAPTRLLDFTESIFIAIFFAIVESKKDSSVWAVNKNRLRDNLFIRNNLPYKKGEALKDEVNFSHINFANQYIARPYKKGQKSVTTIIPLEPKLCSERLAKQQGLFLMPTNNEVSFMTNLQSSFEKDKIEFEDFSFNDLIAISKKDKLETEIDLIKINIPKSLYSEIAEYLKEMNITAEVLFPGIDGLAKSLIQTIIIT